jgi:hypothetical protein
MELVIYHKEYNSSESLDNFLDLYFNKEMKYFAGDLLKEGLSPADIKEAIQRAIAAGGAAGLEIRKHFAPVYSQVNGELIYDCKLSRLGYAMVLLNARPELPIVGEWQLKVLNHFLQ